MFSVRQPSLEHCTTAQLPVNLKHVLQCSAFYRYKHWWCVWGGQQVNTSSFTDNTTTAAAAATTTNLKLMLIFVCVRVCFGGGLCDVTHQRSHLHFPGCWRSSPYNSTNPGDNTHYHLRNTHTHTFSACTHLWLWTTNLAARTYTHALYWSWYALHTHTITETSICLK